MRIVIDLQGLQTGSRFRGIGRYVESFVKALIRNNRGHEIILLIFDYNMSSVKTIRELFSEFTSEVSLRVCSVPTNIYESNKDNIYQRNAGEILRENFIATLKPNFLIITTLFEGYGEDFVCSINETYLVPTAVILYDLIPLINKDLYLADKQVYSWYMNKINNCKNAQLFLAISDSSRQEVIEYLNVSQDLVINISSASDSVFSQASYSEEYRKLLKDKFKINKKYLMYSGATDERKNHLRLIEAFSLLPNSVLDEFQLVIAGGMPEEHKVKFINQAKKVSLPLDNLVITGRVSDEEMNMLYNMSEAFIFPSWHEGFGLPALEAMQCGKAVIASNTSSLPEVIGLDLALFNPFDVVSMKDKIFQVLTDLEFREVLQKNAINQTKKFSWDITANVALDALEACKVQNNQNNDLNLDCLVRKIASINYECSDNDLFIISKSIETNNTPRRILVDITELKMNDSKTGIQRVVRACLKYLHLNVSSDCQRISPIFLDVNGDYCYVNECDISEYGQYVDFCINDIYFCLDLLHPTLVLNNYSLYMKLREFGTRIIFMVYDILPLQYPEYSNIGVSAGHLKWLEVVLSVSDMVIAISQSVLNDVTKWGFDNNLITQSGLTFRWFHLGADLNNSKPSKGLPDDANQILLPLQNKPSFIMVGTLEPRKGHLQTLKAFTQLWQNDIDCNLIIVGKKGWLIDELINMLNSHPELNKRLFWLEGISDEYLEKIYAASTCLIAASEGEGFGLPLIEAAQYKKPIIARNIPVFKEVAGEYAYYFANDRDPMVLAEAIKKWLVLYKEDAHPKSDNMPWLTWEQSTAQLFEIITR